MFLLNSPALAGTLLREVREMVKGELKAIGFDLVPGGAGARFEVVTVIEPDGRLQWSVWSADSEHKLFKRGIL